MRRSLCVLLYHNPSDEIRGKTRRYLYEIKPNVFVGTVTAGVRDILWKKIVESGIKASLICSDQNEQGFSYKTTMAEEESRFLSLDGILLPCSRKNLLSVDDIYAKPDKKLFDHLLEAGTIAQALLTFGRGAKAVRVLAERFAIRKEELISSICFLCSAHDIGKAHPGFQRSMSENNADMADHIRKLTDNGMIIDKDKTIRHERYSREVVEEYLLYSGIVKNKVDIGDLMYVLAYHHQGKAKECKLSDMVSCREKESPRWREWKGVQNDILDRLYEKWPFSQKLIELCGMPGVNGLLYFVLSVMVTADWIVSGNLWRDYLKRHIDIEEAAEGFIDDNYLWYRRNKDVISGVNWESVFDFPMNGLQKKLSDMELAGSSLLLLEYPCGYGKTEAAILAALKSGKECGGIYLAAPTTSTAKGLGERSIVLCQRAGLAINIPEFDGSMIWSEADMAKIPKELWTGRTRHQFLYPFAVGTIDQVLKTILSFRYSCIGLLGLSDKVVIIDEVHAYDAYMLTELICLIKWCRFFDIPVILLSATLPSMTKEKLFKAAGMTSGSDMEISYPLISQIKGKKLQQFTTPCEGRKFTIGIIKTDDIEATMYQKALAHEKGCLAIIMPTVDEAFSLYDRIGQAISDCEIILYQGRDTIKHKTEKVKLLLELLGKDRKYRPKKLIVIATSIIEQSLDVDFDRMITALAPIDLLIQRMGRVWRHSDTGTVRENNRIMVPFEVVIPESYGKLELVYDRGILKNTEETLCSLSEIDTVADVRKLIDQVYDHELSNAGRSEMYAGYSCLDTPFKDESTIISRDDANYRRFDRMIPQTREESYATVRVAILDKEPGDCTYEDMRKIMQENVVNVGEYKLKRGNFSPWENDIKWFENIMVFIGDENLVVRGDDGNMVLSEDGLRFE